MLRDSRWDMTYLGMQVVIEGLALAAFQQIRDHAQNPLAAAVNAYVMQDESRHVAFGRLALRDYYPQLTQKERDEREEFLLEACYLMRDRFDAVEVWKTLGLDPAQVRRAHVRLRLHGDVPLVAVHPHRADREGHRPVGPDHPQGLRGRWASSASPRPTCRRCRKPTTPSPRTSTPAAAYVQSVADRAAALEPAE